MHTCPKCSGTGELPMYRNVAGGVCFSCAGRGTVARKPAQPSRAWVCLYAGVRLFTKRAKTEAAALNAAKAHWRMNSHLPAFVGVTEDQIAVQPA